MISLTVLIVLSLATYRITRFFLFDTLMGSRPESGTKWSAKLDAFGYNEDGSNRSFLRGKIADLLTCPFCFSFWVASALLALWTWSLPWTAVEPQLWLINSFAVVALTSIFYELTGLVERYLDQREEEHHFNVVQEAKKTKRV